MNSIYSSLYLPQKTFGSSGIATGYIISQELAALDNKYKPVYRTNTHTITVLNSSDLPLAKLQIILANRTKEYKGWKPQVEKERDTENNLEIILVCIPPSKNELRNEEYIKWT